MPARRRDQAAEAICTAVNSLHQQPLEFASLAPNMDAVNKLEKFGAKWGGRRASGISSGALLVGGQGSSNRHMSRVEHDVTHSKQRIGARCTRHFYEGALKAAETRSIRKHRLKRSG